MEESICEFCNVNYTPLLNFMRARHEIYLARVRREKPPWTTDKILQAYRFCNVYRELDKVTVWIRENIREPYAKHSLLWFMLCAARQINHPDTLAELMADKANAWPRDNRWSPERMRQIMNDRKTRGEQVYTGAYMLTNSLANDLDNPRDKPWFTVYKTLESVRRLPVTSTSMICMEAVHQLLATGYGWGGFMAYEVVCDMRHTRYGEKWYDVDTFAHAGPGAIRGLNRLHNYPLKDRWSKDASLAAMRCLLADVRKEWPFKTSKTSPRLELREIEHSLCEFDKYERVRLGEGRPRSKYKPS